MRDAVSRLTHALRDRRTREGAFGAGARHAPDTETTALAVLALAAAQGAPPHQPVAWLLARQREDGSWPLRDRVDAPSWATAWVTLALAAAADVSGAPLRRAGTWLVAREGRRSGWLGRLLASLATPEERVSHDLSLRGWPWHDAAASWVEPTAAAILALRHVSLRAKVAGLRERVEEGEKLLADRACPSGGWNYGNARVLGVDMEPYADTTALALLALRRGDRLDLLDAGLDALSRMLEGRASVLALAAGALAFAHHGRDATPLEGRLVQRIERAGRPLETRSLAFALLALSGGARILEAA